MATTQLYLIRHGIADDLHPVGVPGTPLTTAGSHDTADEQRGLTPKGQAKTRQVAQRLRQLQLYFDLLLTSPLVRARQTAEILKSEGLSAHLEESPNLSPLGKFSSWLTWWENWRHSGHTSLALVGHQPDLSQWAEILIWGEAKQVLELKKAGVIGMTLPNVGSPVGNSHLFWLTPPRLLL